MERSRFVWIIGAPVLCVALMGIAAATSDAGFFDATTLVSFATLSAVVVALCWFGLHRTPRSGANREQAAWEVRVNAFFGRPVRAVALLALVMLLCWLPHYVAYIPGTRGWDTGFQILQFYPNHGPILLFPHNVPQNYVQCQFCDHNPLFDTLLFGSFAYVSDVLTGSWVLGLSIYIALQSCAMALAFSLVVAYLHRMGCGPATCIGALTFYCLLPIFPMSSVTILKDTLFSWVFVLFFLGVCEVGRTEGEAMDSRRFAAFFVISALLVALTKKLGIYLVVPTCVALCLMYKSRWMALAAPALATVVLMLLVLPKVIFPLLDVLPGEKQEALGFLFQQTARYVVEHGDEVTTEERDAIDAVLEYDVLAERYEDHNNDPVKFTYRWQTIAEGDLSRYFRVWLAQGVHHPDTYVRATWLLAGSYCNPSSRLDVYRDAGDTLNDIGKAPFFEQTAWLRSTLQTLYDTLAGAPIVGVLLSDALYGVIVPLMSFAYVMTGTDRRKYVVPFVCVFLCMATLVVSPVALSRYLYQLLYVAPLLVGMGWRAHMGHCRS